jgi:hypothetical protein
MDATETLIATSRLLEQARAMLAIEQMLLADAGGMNWEFRLAQGVRVDALRQAVETLEASAIRSTSPKGE